MIPFPFPDSGFRIPCFSAAVFVGFVERKESGIKNAEFAPFQMSPVGAVLYGFIVFFR